MEHLHRQSGYTKRWVKRMNRDQLAHVARDPKHRLASTDTDMGLCVQELPVRDPATGQIEIGRRSVHRTFLRSQRVRGREVANGQPMTVWQTIEDSGPSRYRLIDNPAYGTCALMMRDTMYDERFEHIGYRGKGQWEGQ